MTAPSTAPSRGPEWTLVELMGVQTLQAIQDAFARAFGLPTVIVDHTGRNITEITHRDCSEILRLTDPAGV